MCSPFGGKLPPWRPATRLEGDEENHEPSGLPRSALRPRPIPYMQSEMVFAQSIVSQAEQKQVNTRTRSGDISIALSAATRPLEKTVIEDAGSLLVPHHDGAVCRIESYQSPKSVQPGEAYIPSMILDFGRVITAFPVLKLESAAGCDIRMGYAERLIDGAFNNALECPFADRYITREGYQEWQPSYWRAFRYLKIQFYGKHGAAKLRLHSLSADRTFYPFTYSGGFHSDDTELNELFTICRETTHLCAHEGVMDTPFREGAQWLGDVASVTLPSIYACFGDTVLAEKFLLQSAATQRPTGLLANISNAASDDYSWGIPDYSLWWIEGLWQHFLFSGDEHLLRQLYPVITKMIQCHLPWLQADGLIVNPPGWVFIDWADINRNGASTAYNAIFYFVLGRVNTIAERLGDPTFAELARQLRQQLQVHFDKVFWDEEKGLYHDSYDRGQRSECYSEQSNVLAVLAGLCTPDRRRNLLERVILNPPEGLTEAQPFCSAFSLLACRQNDRMDLAFHILRQRWIERFVKHGETSTPEEWSYWGSWRKGEYFTPTMRTRSHAWSAAPASFLIRGVAGLDILDPGMRERRISPVNTNFAYQIRISTPFGPLTVDWDKKEIKTEVPPEITLRP